MKVTKLFTLLAGSSLLLSASVFAGNSNKKSLHLYESVTVEGKQLPPGDYRIEWTGTGSDVTVNILKGKETVASVPARIVPVNVAFQQDGYTATAQKDGTQSVTQLFFTGQKFDLEIGQAASANTATGAATTSPN
jgi:hypothetical protein